MDTLKSRILNHPVLSEKEIRAHIENYQQTGNKKSREIVILHNQKLIAKIAKKYIDKSFLLDEDDLFICGNIGLLRAIEKFDKTKGTKFSTYARWWIQQAILKEICDFSRVIKIPILKSQKIIGYKKKERNLSQKLKRSPSSKEMADEMDIHLLQIYDIQQVNQMTLSLENPVKHNSRNESVLVDFISDDKISSPEENASQNFLCEKIKDKLGKLKSRERKILKMRHGLADGTPHTLEEVGREFGVTRERIRQIEETAHKKLKKMCEELR